MRGSVCALSLQKCETIISRRAVMAFTKTYTGGMDDSDYEYYSYDNNTDINEDFICDKEELMFEDFYSVFSPVLNSLFFLLGLVGNGLMVTILLKRHRRLRITEIYLLHLALADLILIFTLPFNVVESVAGWLFGEFFCMLYGVLRNLYLLCGSFLLACIGFDRYLAIVHAIPSMQSRRPKRVHLTCASLWLICFLLSLPNAVFLSVKSDKNDSLPECFYYRYEINAQNWVLANRVLHHVSFFFSLAVMCYCYTALVITLFKSQKSQAKKGAIRLALLVTTVFCVCWLPNNITSLMNTLAELEVVKSDTCWPKLVLAHAHAVTESLGVSHCCLNPFLYAFVGVQFRNELLHLLCRLGCGRFCLRFIKAQNYGRPSVSDGTTSNSMVMY